jgi:chromate transport protein ChrA
VFSTGEAAVRLARRAKPGRNRGRVSAVGDTVSVTLALEIVVTVLVSIPLAVVLYVFVWAARKDGEEDRALQRRLGIRRRTRLGR